MHKAFIYNAVRIPTTPPFGHPSFPKGGEFEILTTYEIYSFRFSMELKPGFRTDPVIFHSSFKTSS